MNTFIYIALCIVAVSAHNIKHKSESEQALFGHPNPEQYCGFDFDLCYDGQMTNFFAYDINQFYFLYCLQYQFWDPNGYENFFKNACML